MKKSTLPFVALLVAIAASAFTKADTAPEDTMYWFPTDANGTIVSQTITANEHLVKPCDADGDYCAVGFTDQQVINNGDGTVTLQSGLDKDDGAPALRP